MRTVLAVVLVACLASGTAHAGRSFYGWLYPTEVMPERGVELQTWIIEQNDKHGAKGRESSLWWGALIGVTDRLELALPIELEWSRTDEDETRFTFRRFGLEARYRFVTPDPEEAPALVPLLRAAVKRDVSARDDVRLEADAVLSYEAGPVHVLLDAGFVSDVKPNQRHSELRPGGGFSIRVGGGVRLGAEAYAELSLDSREESWAAAGPNLSWTHGRFWFSGAFGIGLYHVKLAPRFMWGVLF